MGELDLLVPDPPATHWHTRDGRVLDITEMTDLHLVNAIKYLERGRGLWIGYDVEDIEMPYQEIYENMLAEAQHRRLQIR